MLFFSIIIYTLFGLMCLWFVISGVRKMNEIKQNQALASASKEEEKQAQENQEAPEEPEA